jgi:hypothetical protein
MGMVEVLVVEGADGVTSRFELVLQQCVAELDAAHESASSSAPPFDDSEILTLLKRTVEDCAAALLDELGEPRKGQESPDALIDRLVAAIPNHPDRFAKEAPIVVLERKAAGLHQVLRDVEYLRQGIGLAKSGHKPADMKWDHASTAESFAITALRRIASELRTEGADVERLRPEADVDLAHTRARIIQLLGRDIGPAEFMAEAIDLGRSQTGGAGWDVFRDLPYEGELEDRSSFFLDVITRQPPKAPLVGLYAEIAYPSRGGETVADIDLTGADSYQPDDEWFAHLNYTPKNGYLHSEILASIYRLAYAPGGLGNAADYTLCLAWAAYFSRACARRYLAEVGSDFVGLRVGFSGGAWIDLGWVRRPRRP